MHEVVERDEQIEDVQTNADNGSPRTVEFVSITDEETKSKKRGKPKKVRPTSEETKKNKARVGISYGRKEFVGKQLDLLLNAVVEAGYTECELVVGGFVQRHNYLRNLTAKGKQLGSDYPKEFAGKTIADLTSEQIEALIQTTTFKKEAEDYGRMCEKTWYEKHKRQIEDFRAKGINVTVTFWEKALQSDEVKKLHKLVDDICRELEAKSPGLLKDEKDNNSETEESRRLNQLKKELYADLIVAVDQIWATQAGEEDNVENYRDTVLSNKPIFVREIAKFIKDELGVLPSPHTHFIYPMERHPGARTICKTVEKLAAIAGIEMRVFSANYKAATSPKTHPKANQKESRRNSDGDHQPLKQPPVATRRKGSADAIEIDGGSPDSSLDHEDINGHSAPSTYPPNSAHLAAKVGLYKAAPSQGQPVPHMNGQRKGQEGSASTSTDSSSSNSTSPDDQALLSLEAEISKVMFYSQMAKQATEIARQNPAAKDIGTGVASEMLGRAVATVNAVQSRTVVISVPTNGKIH